MSGEARTPEQTIREDRWRKMMTATLIDCPYEKRIEGRRVIIALVAELDGLRADLAAARETLKQIQAWDCLNPPDPNLCADHPWLKRLVDAALAAAPASPAEAPQAEPASEGGDR